MNVIFFFFFFLLTAQKKLVNSNFLLLALIRFSFQFIIRCAVRIFYYLTNIFQWWPPFVVFPLDGTLYYSAK